MVGRVFITGHKQIQANFQASMIQLKQGALDGMVNSAKMVHQGMLTQSPTIPKKTGNLRNSWFIVSSVKVEEGASARFVGEEAANRANEHGAALAKASGETQKVGGLDVVLGFSAGYGIWVHEMPDTYNWSQQGSGPKFLEKALKKRKAEIIKTMQRSMILKGYGKTARGPGLTVRQDVVSGKF